MPSALSPAKHASSAAVSKKAFLAACCVIKFSLAMFMRSSAQFVRKSSRTLHANARRSLCCEYKVPEVDEVKRVAISFRKPDGRIINVKAKVNETVYDAVSALDPDTKEKDFFGYGFCGGILSCSTCHVILAEKDMHKPQPACDDEENLVGYAKGSCKFSRLGCKIRITNEMEGMVFKLPSDAGDCPKEDEEKKINQS